MRLPSYQDLSKEQDAVNSLPLDGSYLVTGPPGTGKTVMALYRASMLQSKRRPVHLLMHGRLLAQYTRTAVDELLIDGSVTTYHSWLTNFFWKQYTRGVPSHSAWEYDWGQILQVVNSAPPPKTEAQDLIVDEGQDLPKEFYILARLVSKNLTVFADENQRLRESNSTLDEIRAYGGFSAANSFALTKNYRNTKEIASLAASFYTGLETGIPQLPTRSGDRPVLSRYPNLGASVEFIRNFESINSDLEIGVIAPTETIRERIVSYLGDETVNQVQTYFRKKGVHPPELNFEMPGIKVINHPSAKGLEFDAVFLPGIHELRDPLSTLVQMRMYVLTSRARDALFVSYWTTETPHIVSDVPDELFEVRE